MKSQNAQRFLSVLALMMVISLGPVSSVAFGQEDTTTSQELDVFELNTVQESDENTIDEEQTDVNKEKRQEKIRELKEQRAEKVRDAKEKLTDQYKDRIRPGIEHDVRPYDIPPDREADLSFKGNVSGWSLIGGFAYESSTSLAGEAFHIKGNLWKVHVNYGEIQIGDRILPIKMQGFVSGNHLHLRGIAELPSGNEVNIGLGGKYAPTTERGEFALMLTKLWYQTDQNSGRIHLAQVGQVNVEANKDSTRDIPMPEPAPIDVPEILT